MSEKPSETAESAAPESTPVPDAADSRNPFRRAPDRAATPPPVGGSRSLEELEALARERSTVRLLRNSRASSRKAGV